MSMGHPHGLTIQNMEIDDVSIASLAGKTAVSLHSTFTSTIQNPFLVKKVRMMLNLSGGVNEDEFIGVFLAAGNADAAEVAASMTQINTVGPTDRTQMLAEDARWSVWQKTVQMFRSVGPADGATVALGRFEVDRTISLGKGFVAREGEGVQAWAFNMANNAMGAAAQEVTGIIQLWGVWLNE